MSVPKPKKKYKSKKSVSKSAKTADLSKKLFSQIILIFVILIVMVLSVTRFAPMIGGLFGFISIHRGEKTETLNTALPPPVFIDPPEAVKETTVTLTGLSEAKTTVKLYVNGPEKDSVLADDSGEFTFIDVKLNSGKNTIFAKAESDKDRKSDKSETLIIHVDKEEPKIDIDSPKDGETVRNLDKRVLIEGKVNEEATVTINDRKAVVKPDNSFEFLLGVDEGNVKITIKAVDKAGNEEEKVINISYEKKSS